MSRGGRVWPGVCPYSVCDCSRPDVSGERYPIHRALFENAKGPIIYTLLDRLDHSGYAGWPINDELREMGITSDTSTGLDGDPFVLQDPATLNEIRDHFLISFYDVYLKGKVDRLRALTENEFEEVGLRLEVKNTSPQLQVSAANDGKTPEG